MEDESSPVRQASGEETSTPVERRVSRRGVIAKGAAVAAGGVGLVALAADPAHAGVGTMQYGTSNDAGQSVTTLRSTTNTFTLRVYNDDAVFGGVGVAATGAFGVSGRGLLVGVVAEGDPDLAGAVPLLVRPNGLIIGQPTVGYHELGSVSVDKFGRFFTCIEAGRPGRWAHLGFNDLIPFRVCDTRAGTGTPYSTGAKLGPGQTLDVKIAGEAGVPVPEFATSIVGTVTVTDATASSYLTVYPAHVSRPTASNINFVGGQTVANQVTVGLSTPGDIKIYNRAGSVHVILDLAGFHW